MSGSPSRADGVYGASATQIMDSVAGGDSTASTQTDRNVAEWYAQKLPSDLSQTHVIDWGAGVGRMVPFYETRKAAHITLVEPSTESFAFLRERFDSSDTISLVNDGIGTLVESQSGQGLHICNFVINCISDLETAFRALRASIEASERLLLVTNVFAPKTLVGMIRDNQAKNAVLINIQEPNVSALRLPQTPVFTNVILSTGAVLKDSVHTTAEYSTLWQTEGQFWDVISAELMLPDGFEHRALPGEDFGDFQFAVLLMELRRK